MPATFTTFRCLLISPDDVQEERDAISRAVGWWNAHIGSTLNVRIEVVQWEPRSRREVAVTPRSATNRPLVDNYDFGIAVFWCRLGRPTINHSSELDEEIEHLLATSKTFMVYFCDRDIPQERLHDNQFAKLQEVKRVYSARGLLETYRTTADLTQMLIQHWASVVRATVTDSLTPSLVPKMVHEVSLQEPAAPPALSPSDEDVLTFMGDAERHGEKRTAVHRVAEEYELSERAAWASVQRLEKSGFVEANDGGAMGSFHRSAALTRDGRQRASDLKVPSPKGPMSVFSKELEEQGRTLLDVVVEQQLRRDGSSVGRSEISRRTRMIHADMGIEIISQLLATLSPAHLIISSARNREPAFKVTLRGLLASGWGLNAFELIGQVLDALRSFQDADPAVQHYSWRDLRRALKLPSRALDIAYITISVANLGAGLKRIGDGNALGWEVPPDLDFLLQESSSALEHIQRCIEAVARTGAGASPHARKRAPEASPVVTNPLSMLAFHAMIHRRKYTTFISSTYSDLHTERQMVTWEIMKVGHFPSGMEVFPATDDRGWQIIQEAIDESDYYVLIIGGRYGSVDENTGVSWTEREYDYAKSRGIPVFAFVRRRQDIRGDQVDIGANAEKLAVFLDKVKKAHLYKEWTTADSLRAEVARAIEHRIRRDEASNPISGWVRAESLEPSLVRSKRDPEWEHALRTFLRDAQKFEHATGRLPVKFRSLDTERGLPPGTAARLLPRVAANEPGWSIHGWGTEEIVLRYDADSGNR